MCYLLVNKQILSLPLRSAVISFRLHRDMEPTICEEPGNNNETIPFSKPITPLPIGINAAYKDGKHGDLHETYDSTDGSLL